MDRQRSPIGERVTGLGCVCVCVCMYVCVSRGGVGDGAARKWRSWRFSGTGIAYMCSSYSCLPSSTAVGTIDVMSCAKKGRQPMHPRNRELKLVTHEHLSHLRLMTHRTWFTCTGQAVPPGLTCPVLTGPSPSPCLASAVAACAAAAACVPAAAAAESR